MARRHGRPLAVAVITLEGLDEIGLSYGRDEQQLALIECADLLRSSLDEPASLALIDNRRFAISLLPALQTDLTMQVTALEKRFQRLIATKMNRSQLRFRKGFAWRYPGDNVTLTELLDRASQGLCENVVGETFHATEFANSARRNV